MLQLYTPHWTVHRITFAGIIESQPFDHDFDMCHHHRFAQSPLLRLHFRESFQEYAGEIAGHRHTEFWDSWKNHRVRYPMGERRAAAAVARPVSISSRLGGDDDDDVSAAGASAGPAAAAAAGPAAAAANADDN